jgi:dTDP-4-dehydrorhamnose reductase
LTGAGGQVGQELLSLLSPLSTSGKFGEVIAASRVDCDLASPESIRCLVAEVQPAVIVNAAAYTSVDEAEAQPELACAVNATAPGVLAEEARKLDAMLVHYSTDYVFNGSNPDPYTEEDSPAPLNVYGASKLAGERAVSACQGRSLVLRTSWVYSATGGNFLLAIRRLAQQQEELKVVDDQIGAPTSAAQIARATAELVRRYAGVEAAAFPAGVYHMTAAGSTSWCGFARAIVAALDVPDNGLQLQPIKLRRIVPIASTEYPTRARRPFNSRLDNAKFERTFGFKLESWELGLAEVVRELRLR